MDTQTIIIAIVGSVFASTGFWTLIQRVLDYKSAETKLLLCIAGDVIERKGDALLAQGDITTDEYDEYMKYYTPYKKAGGNGTVERLTKEIEKLPIRKEVQS